MAAKKKVTKKSTRPAAKKKAGKKTASRSTKSPRPRAGGIRGKLIPKGAQVIYVDSCFFFPPQSAWGYVENFQEGRNTITPRMSLMASLPLPVNSVIKSVTIYYKNVSKEDMQVVILKKHIDHHAFSGEVEVSIDFLPPATVPPDDFAARLIDHFDAGGLIKDKYLYYIEISNTIKSDDEVRTVRGMRIEYTM